MSDTLVWTPAEGGNPPKEYFVQYDCRIIASRERDVRIEIPLPRSGEYEIVVTVERVKEDE